MIHHGKALVRSIKERCRACFVCVRECPAKAIRISQGQAEVIPERCIGCGNCFRVCSRNAKEVLSSVNDVEKLIASNRKTAAILAPSFPVEFTDMNHKELISRIRLLGFNTVHEVAFGADLVAKAYRKLLQNNPERRFIATSCPAIVAYVEKFTPSLVEYLAPIVSPMVAMARVVRKQYSNNCNIVFIGPCIAKKAEEDMDDSPPDVDAILTFAELRTMLNTLPTPAGGNEHEFDPPFAGKGRLFAIARGLLETAGIEEDLTSGDIIATDGRDNFPEAIREFEKSDTPLRFLEVLSCRGCIMGAGMANKTMSLFERRAAVGRYTRAMLGDNLSATPLDTFADIPLNRTFRAHDQRLPDPSEERIEDILKRLGKNNLEDELNCGACGYETCRKHAIAILKGIAENEMCLPYVIDRLKLTVEQLAESNEEIAATRSALMQSEKLASMGQLAAGVAHEVNNPLGIVLMYAHLLLEEHGENLLLREDLSTIVEQADRCKRIVSGLLNFARQNKTICQPTNVDDLVLDTIKTVNLPDAISVAFDSHLENPIAEIDREQVAQLLVNLFTNAQAAMPAGGELTIELKGNDETISFDVRDTGVGIPEENLSKIFDPFFTTKQIGKGTGLGLAVLYGIVKMHRGSVNVKSNTDPAKGPCGTVFSVTLPRYEKNLM
jgi:two-component system NtrC family sensor kinase